MHNKAISPHIAIFFIAMSLSGCVTTDKDHTDKKSDDISQLEKVTANEEVTNYLKSFEGCGALADNSKPSLPQEALADFQYPDDLELDLILSEPDIHQLTFVLITKIGFGLCSIISTPIRRG